MNIRQEQKRETRKKILSAAKTIFIEKGILNVATAQIAERAGVAHGTLFLHFPNKDLLLVEMLDLELSKFNNSINRIAADTHDLRSMLEQYLQLIIKEEDFFSSLARELPGYKPELKRKVLFRESILREHFYNELSKGMGAQKYSSADIPVILIFLFGTINYYLTYKMSFVSKGSVIEKFQDQIVDVFFKLLRKGS